ncbi:MAG: DUF4097 family beta strand repeat protein [Candidatus Aminicenantes bacterium]|nr:MAG: DUF4097 family beta strand repeat protein [Candidatus Aminicenantes bacterium]
MMSKKTLVLLVVLAVLIFFLGLNPLEASAQGKVKHEEKFEKTESLARDGKVEIRNISGDVDVVTWDRNEVKIDALKTSKASSMDKAKENASKVKIEVTRENGILKIETKYPKPSIKNLSVSVNYKVTIPSQAAVKAKSVSGSVTLENIGGNAAAETKSGNVTVYGARNGAKAETVSGSVKVRDIDNGVYCKTASGNVRAENVTGNADLKCVSGDVTAENIRGDVEADTVSGNVKLLDITGANVVKGKTMSGSTIYLGEISPNGRYSLNAHSGTVEMTIPSNSAFDLNASTFSGSIKTEFKVMMSGTLSKKKISGSVNGGGADVTLKTFSGSVYLKKK